MKIIIDPNSGFCFGVKRAISLAESEAAKVQSLYCLGDIVHNAEEIKRLQAMGVQFIDRKTFDALTNCKVIIRAHGEPPETYQHAKTRNIELIDATCPVVLKLQERIRSVQHIHPEAQIVIYGRPDHPEVIGLCGQAEKVVVIESTSNVEKKVDTTRPVFLFAQTTKDKKMYADIKNMLLKKLKNSGLDSSNLVVSNSICGQVANRAPWLKTFSKSVDAVIFVGGKLSSNSKILFEVCKNNNPNSFFITSVNEAGKIKLETVDSVGITGATSTPSWLIESVARYIQNHFSSKTR